MRILFNLGKGNFSIKKETQKREKAPKTSCFPPTCARAFPQLR
jgi:hypothetical protein